jgi:hypothetical protein
MLDFSFVVFVSPCPPHRAKGKKTSEPPVDERKRPAVLYTVHKPDLHAAPVGLGMVVNADL